MEGWVTLYICWSGRGLEWGREPAMLKQVKVGDKVRFDVDRMAEPFIKDLQAGARTLGLPAEVLYAGTDREIDAAFATLVQKRADVLLIAPDALFTSRRAQLATLSLRHAVPSTHVIREFAEAGGLISYGPNLADAYQQTGIYTGRILKGERPADLPVAQRIKFELVINLKTAKMLGLNVPDKLLALADEVIE
jgi:putative tryptophan/tyrosine transport system substrate-binding protein